MTAPLIDPLIAAAVQAACVSVHEPDRLAALRGLGLLDSPRSASFDRVTRQAARALGMPIVLVSLVDADRQWFMSRVGLDASETSRDVSFCAHAVYECRPLIVPDAVRDSRFAANPLVTGAPHIRAYVGIPLYTQEGFAIGTLCAIDRKPREFSEDDVNTLRDFAYMIEDFVHGQQLVSRVEQSALKNAEQNSWYRDGFEQAPAGILHVDLDGTVMRANRHARALLKWTTEDPAELFLTDLYDGGPDAAREWFVKTAAGEMDGYRATSRWLDKEGGMIWVEQAVALKRLASGAPDSLIAVVLERAGPAQLSGIT